MASSIQLLRSTNAQERPFSANLLEGQPAVNLNASEPGLFFKAADGSLVKFGPAAITSDGSPPNSAPQGSSGNSVGELWLDKSVDPPVLKVYDGVNWIDAGSGGGGGGGGSASFVRWIYTSIGGETSLSGTSGGVLLEYTPGLEEVFVNGVLLTRGADYSAVTGSSITNLSALTAGDVVTVTSLNPIDTIQLPGQVQLLRWTILASSGQTLLTGVDSSGQQLAYTAGFEEVYVNGAFLRRGTDYTATSGSTITVASPLSEDDEITVMAWSPFEVGDVSADDITGQIPSTQVDFRRSPSLPIRTVDNKFREFVSVKDYGATGDGATDDTAAIQSALNDFTSGGIGTLFFPKATYAVTKLTLLFDNSSFKSIFFNGSTLKGIATTPTNCVLQINARNLYIEDLKIVSNFNTNYTAAIHWYSTQAGRPAEWIHIHKIYLQYFLIGVLFGQLDGQPVIDSPQSENFITHADFRGVETNFYCRQPNGFLFVSESTLDCAPYEWTTSAPGVFSQLEANCVTNLSSTFNITNCEVLKTSTTQGRCIYNESSLAVNASTIESAATFYEAKGGKFNLNGVVTTYFANAVTPYFKLLPTDPGSKGVVNISQFNLQKAPSAVSANMPVIELSGSDAYSVTVDGCYFANQNQSNIISISTPDQSVNCFTGSVQLTGCRVATESDPINSLVEISNTHANIWPDISSFDISNWTITSTGGASASVTDTPDGRSELVFSGVSGNFVTALSPITAVPGIGRYGFLGFQHKYTGSSFTGQVVVYFYTKNSSGAFLLRETRQLTLGGVGSIYQGSASTPSFLSDQLLFRIAKSQENYTHMAVRFGLQSAGTYEITGITLR